MKPFRDTANREWAITVDVGAVKRVMKAPIEHLGEPLKVNLLALVEPDGELLKKVVEYPPLVCDIAYALLKPQCDAKNVTDEDFGRAMAGHGWFVISGAASGIMEACHVGAGREHSMGLNILLPFEQSANPIIAGDRKLVYMKYFFTRKLMFVK